jgi:hypothetical protein
MIHLANISWVQFILIQIGVVLLFIAMSVFMRETSAYRRLLRPMKNGVNAQAQGRESRMFDETGIAHTDSTPHESFNGSPHTEIKAGHLTRTSKVKFAQTFKFRRHGT